MSRALAVVAAGVAVGLLLVAVAQVFPGMAVAAFFFLFAVAIVAPIDMLTLPRQHGRRIGSVDVLWAMASIPVFPWASLAWLLFGRSIRRCELERKAADAAAEEITLG